MRVTVLKPHSYAGKRRVVGDSYECPKAHAKALQAAKAVRIEGVWTNEMKASADAVDSKKRTYKRRDMKAED